MSTPYRGSAFDYWEAGWRGILPIPPYSKRLAIKGWTGHEGRTPSYADIYTWSEGSEGDGNIALRMPPNVVGIDLDDYGAKIGALTIHETEAICGPLPATYRSTARPDGRSGIYFYRIPEGLRWPGQVGTNVEIIQHSHRYAVVWPSWNPDAKAQYRWYGPDGEPADIPNIDDLPELPAQWVTGLTQYLTLEIEHKAAISRGGVAKWLREADIDGSCRMMAHAIQKAEDDFRHGSRHDALNRSTLAAIRLADGGHRAIHHALIRIRDAFERAAADSSRGMARDDAALEGEWNRSVEGAVALVIASDPKPVGSTRNPCTCDDDPASLVASPVSPDFGGPLTTFIAEPVDSPPVVPARRYQSRILSIDQLRNLPPLKPLIADTLERSTIFMVAGDFGTYKSFLVLDWAGCIASGHPWIGREIVEPAPVLYVCGEGAGGISKRMSAWSHVKSADLAKFYTLPTAVNLGDRAAVVDLAAEIRELEIGFVIFDTLNRCASGLEENSAKDMGIVLDSLSYLRDVREGTTVGVIHHSGKDGSKERGSSALADGVDTLYFTTGGHGEPMQLERRKRKDGEERDEHAFRLRLVAGTESGVLDPMGAERQLDGRSNADRVFEVFRSVFVPISKKCSRAELRDYMASEHRMSKSSFNYALSQLVTAKRFKVSKRGAGEVIEYGSHAQLT